MPERKPPLEVKVYKHWTSAGVFTIVPVYPGGSLHCELRFEGERLGTYVQPYTATEDLASGRHDSSLGFSARDAGVPLDPEAWNDLE